jgi:hypothetical protein
MIGFTAMLIVDCCIFQHHCRHCGRIFCHYCSSKSRTLMALGYNEPVRICDKCFEVTSRRGTLTLHRWSRNRSTLALHKSLVHKKARSSFVDSLFSFDILFHPNKKNVIGDELFLYFLVYMQYRFHDCLRWSNFGNNRNSQTSSWIWCD